MNLQWGTVILGFLVSSMLVKQAYAFLAQKSGDVQFNKLVRPLP